VPVAASSAGPAALTSVRAALISAKGAPSAAAALAVKLARAGPGGRSRQIQPAAPVRSAGVPGPANSRPTVARFPATWMQARP